jgi:hypothetical protein
MTDPHDLDELASAHLDGTTTPDEAARIAADPELQARVRALQAARDAVRAPVPADPDRREAALAAALAAFDQDAIRRPADRRVVPHSSRTTLRVLGAAAVVALLALLIPVLGTGGDDDETATGDSAEDASSGADDAGAEAGAGLDPTSTTTPAGANPQQLGTYPSIDELLRAIEGGEAFSADGGGGATSQPTSAGASCPVPEPPATIAEAFAGGRSVLVFLTRADGDVERITVVDATTCEVLAERVR